MPIFDKPVDAISLNSYKKQFRIKNTPDECPLCHSKVSPIILGFFYEGDDVQGAFRCPNEDCAKIFIGLFRRHRDGFYELAWTYPQDHVDVKFSEEISNLSKMFPITYNQAKQAEDLKLGEITGMGYRKSLEYLIKDFLINQHPEKEEEIKKTFLGNCINLYIDDTNLKSTAKRAVWLGNDESHYVRKWEDKDIQDLKLLIKLSINWIENILLTNKYLNEMPEKK